MVSGGGPELLRGRKDYIDGNYKKGKYHGFLCGYLEFL